MRKISVLSFWESVGLGAIFLIMFLNVTSYADSSKIQNPNNGHLYQRFDTEMTWTNACAYCESLGGHLATITSQDEDDFVYSNLGIDGISIWLGGTDETTEGTWKWITGEFWSYTNWAGGQPEGRGEPQHKYLQNLIKKYAERLGYRVIIEKSVEQGKVDLALKKMISLLPAR